MDTLDQQIQVLVDEAPSEGGLGQAIVTIAPVLKTIAQQLLSRTEYYVLQTLDRGWVMTTLTSRQQPPQRRNVIYAFPTLKDAASGPQSNRDPQLMAIPMPVTHILFQMLALKSLDSIIFFDTPGALNQGIEVRRQEFQNLIQAQLQSTQASTQGDVALG